ncbi:MAG: hypothetical protein ACRED1_06230, partial [Limisphaerales bacterium]
PYTLSMGKVTMKEPVVTDREGTARFEAPTGISITLLRKSQPLETAEVNAARWEHCRLRNLH